MNKLLLYLVGGAVLLQGCVNKIDPNVKPVVPVDPSQTTTIKAIGGSSQTDTIGASLTDSIIVKINEPGSMANKLLVQIFQKTLCSGDSVTERTVFNGARVSYKWRLSGQAGVQTLTFKVLDASHKAIDSITVTATAKPAARGWHVSSCIIKPNLYVLTFAKLSTGRLLVGFMGDFYPYYSDDNGASWHPLRSFYFGYYPWVVKIATTPTDEIFIGSELDGVFYSGDGGVTWTNRSNGIPALTPITDLAYTPDGRLIFTSHGGGVYVSYDKGISWTAISPHDTRVLIEHNYVAMQTGDLYFTKTINFKNTLVRLDHNTNKMVPVTNLPAIDLGSFYIDANGNQYAGGKVLPSKTAELYRSADGGTNWVKIFTAAVPDVSPPALDSFIGISRQGDSNYYFWGPAGYYKTADFKAFQTITSDVSIYSGRYVVAANTNLVINSFPSSIWYYVQ